MKTFVDMTDLERGEFLVRASRLWKEVDDNASDPDLRPALLVLWAMAEDRTTLNLWTHYDVDPSGFIDEAVRKGSLFLLNLQQAIEMHPPPRKRMTRNDLAWGLKQIKRASEKLGEPKYRKAITFIFEDYFRDAREEGEL